MHKCNVYENLINDAAEQMTLTGQEARIQIRYYLPDHPMTEVYTELCRKYKDYSAQQMKEHRRQATDLRIAKAKQNQLDQEFASRLMQKGEAYETDLDQEEDLLKRELPRPKKIRRD